MKQFLKPSIWKILLFIIIFVLTYFLWLDFSGFFNLTFCGLELPYPYYKVKPFSFSETLNLIPHVITGNYNRCDYTSQSLMVAGNIVFYGSIVVFAVISYTIACAIVVFTGKLKKQKQKTAFSKRWSINSVSGTGNFLW